MFILKIIWNSKVENAQLQIVKPGGTYSYHRALIGQFIGSYVICVCIYLNKKVKHSHNTSIVP
jgi:hypothetical protein